MNLNEYKKSWDFFEKNFLNKIVTYEYYDAQKQLKAININFTEKNFQHLCGIRYKLGAKRFVQDLKYSKISEKNIVFNENKKVIESKNSIIACSSLLFDPSIRISERGQFVHLEFDHAIRSRNDLFAFTLVTQNTGLSIFNSLINLRLSKAKSKVFKNSFKVNRIYVTNKKDRSINEIYNSNA